MDGVRRGGPYSRPYSAKAEGKGGKGGGKLGKMRQYRQDLRQFLHEYGERAFGGPCKGKGCQKGKDGKSGKSKRMAIWTRLCELFESDDNFPELNPEYPEPPTKNLLAKLQNQHREFKDEALSLWDQLTALDQEALQEEAQEEAAASSSSNDSAAAGAATATSNDYLPGQFMSLLQ